MEPLEFQTFYDRFQFTIELELYLSAFDIKSTDKSTGTTILEKTISSILHGKYHFGVYAPPVSAMWPEVIKRATSQIDTASLRHSKRATNPSGSKDIKKFSHSAEAVTNSSTYKGMIQHSCRFKPEEATDSSARKVDVDLGQSRIIHCF
jgi:hypothetical protein